MACSLPGRSRLGELRPARVCLTEGKAFVYPALVSGVAALVKMSVRRIMIASTTKVMRVMLRGRMTIVMLMVMIMMTISMIMTMYFYVFC